MAAGATGRRGPPAPRPAGSATSRGSVSATRRCPRWGARAAKAAAARPKAAREPRARVSGMRRGEAGLWGQLGLRLGRPESRRCPALLLAGQEAALGVDASTWEVTPTCTGDQNQNQNQNGHSRCPDDSHRVCVTPGQQRTWAPAPGPPSGAGSWVACHTEKGVGCWEGALTLNLKVTALRT